MKTKRLIFLITLFLLLPTHINAQNREIIYRIDQANLDYSSNRTGVTTNASDPDWQTFTTGNVNNISRIDIDFTVDRYDIFHLAFGLYNVTHHIFEPALYRNEILQEPSSLEGTYFVKFIFEPIPVNPNTTYYLQFYVDFGDSGGVWDSTSNPYPGGRADGGDNYDYVFVTYYSVGTDSQTTITETETSIILETTTTTQITTDTQISMDTTTITTTASASFPYLTSILIFFLPIIFIRRKK